MPWNLPYLVKRIQFRPLRIGDLADFLVYRGDPVVARFQGWGPMGESEAMEFLAKESEFTGLTPGAWSQIGIVEAGNDKLIGDAGLWLSEDSAVAEFGISLARKVQGQGLGSEAATGLIKLIFSSTLVGEVFANTDERNQPCIRALECAGMSRCDTRSETYKGEVCTEYCFRIMRP